MIDFNRLFSKTKARSSSSIVNNFGLKPFGGKKDWDGDGVPNKFDCQPRNTMRQHRFRRITEDEYKKVYENPEGTKIVMRKRMSPIPRGQAIPTVDDIAYVMDNLPLWYAQPKPDEFNKKFKQVPIEIHPVTLETLHKEGALKRLQSDLEYTKEMNLENIKENEKSRRKSFKGTGISPRFVLTPEDAEKQYKIDLKEDIRHGTRGGHRGYTDFKKNEFREEIIINPTTDISLPETRHTIVHEIGHGVGDSIPWSKRKEVFFKEKKAYQLPTYYAYGSGAEHEAEVFALANKAVPKKDIVNLEYKEEREKLFEEHKKFMEEQSGHEFKPYPTIRELEEEKKRPENLIKEELEREKQELEPASIEKQEEWQENINKDIEIDYKKKEENEDDDKESEFEKTD